MVFIIACDKHYSKMAQAVINSLNYYHDNCRIIVYSTDSDSDEILNLKNGHNNIRIIPFNDLGYHYGEWHPLIWAKIEAFNLDIDEPVMFLDVDVIIYRSLSDFFDCFEKSAKIIGASRDFAPFVKQFNGSFDFCQFFFNNFFQDSSYLTAPAFNAGAIIFRPNKNVYKELKILSENLHHFTFYPEQAILNYYCFINDGWMEIEDLSILPFSSRVLNRNNDIGMLHFFTPRPDCMMNPIIRSGEPTLADVVSLFEKFHKTNYPLAEIEQEYLDRLANKIPKTI